MLGPDVFSLEILKEHLVKINVPKSIIVGIEINQVASTDIFLTIVDFIKWEQPVFVGGAIDAESRLLLYNISVGPVVPDVFAVVAC